MRAMRKTTQFFMMTAILVVATFLSSCGHTLQSESGLYNVELQSTYKLPVRGVWFSGKGNQFNKVKAGTIYVAPLNVDAIQAEYPEQAAAMKQELHGFVSEYLGKTLADVNRANKTNWQSATAAAGADIRVDMAVVHFREQRPFLHAVVDVLSNWSPIPMTSTIAAPLSKGDICLEMTIRDNRSGELLLALKDENKGGLEYYKAEAYSKHSNATASLKAWARMLANIIRETACDRSGGQSLQQRVENMSMIDTALLRTTGVNEDHLDD